MAKGISFDHSSVQDYLDDRLRDKLTSSQSTPAASPLASEADLQYREACKVIKYRLRQADQVVKVQVPGQINAEPNDARNAAGICKTESTTAVGVFELAWL